MTWVDKVTIFTLRFPKNISGNLRYWNWVLWLEKDFSLRSSLHMTILVLWNLSWATAVCWSWLILAWRTDYYIFRNFAGLVVNLLVAWSWPWWEFLCYQSGQTLINQPPCSNWLLNFFTSTRFVAYQLSYYYSCLSWPRSGSQSD